MLNSVQLHGRLTAEPQYKQGNTPMVRFSLAVQRNFKNQEGNYDADFINCMAFGKRANMIAQYFHKGSEMIATGEWRTGSYTNQQGQKIYTNELNVNTVDFAGGKNSENQNSNQQRNSQQGSYGGTQTVDVTDDELPF